MTETAIEYTTVSLQYPLWSSIPHELRITEPWIREKYARYHSEWAREKIALWLDRIQSPQCEIAVRPEGNLKFYSPCLGDTHGDTRCRRHGGKASAPPRMTRRELEQEVARLRGMEKTRADELRERTLGAVELTFEQLGKQIAGQHPDYLETTKETHA